MKGKQRYNKQKGNKMPLSAWINSLLSSSDLCDRLEACDEAIQEIRREIRVNERTIQHCVGFPHYCEEMLLCEEEIKTLQLWQKQIECFKAKGCKGKPPLRPIYPQ